MRSRWGARATVFVPLPKEAQKLPEILSREEVARLLGARRQSQASRCC